MAIRRDCGARSEEAARAWALRGAWRLILPPTLHHSLGLARNEFQEDSKDIDSVQHLKGGGRKEGQKRSVHGQKV
eukprot:3077347-Rhodomonas_salina.3